jgi:hypothetical protein
MRFRIYDPERDAMLRVFEIDFAFKKLDSADLSWTDLGAIDEELVSREYNNDNSVILMRGSPVRDRNNRIIWEGDLLEFHKSFFEHSSLKPSSICKTLKVIFDKEKEIFVYNNAQESHDTTNYFIPGHNLVIVGNIYENNHELISNVINFEHRKNAKKVKKSRSTF